MKALLTILIAGSLCHHTYAQDSMEKTMEKRAREMHRVLCLADKNEWVKFVKENYTQALIERPMRAQIAQEGGASTKEENIAATAESKAAMFERLHQDFGNSKITSIQSNGEILTMVLGGSDMSGSFKLKFEKSKPYRIDVLGIEIGN